jgi:transaldolase
MTATAVKSPLQQTAETTVTEYWNDSCSIEELKYAIENGAVGATSNPTIVLGVLKKEMPLWKDRIYQIINDNPTWSEDQITWKLIEEMAVKGANLLMPIFQREKGKKGRLSIQTNPALYRNADAILQQAMHFHELAPNMNVKIPATKAGIKAIEEATYHGASINATVSFSVPQALAVGAAVERSLKRREAEGLPIDEMSPICTIMIGRLDDWIHVLEKRDSILVTPGYGDWAGIAAFKRAVALYQERGYRSRLLAAAYRHHMHWSELIGGDISMTIPYEWQKLFNASDIEVKERFNDPVPTEIVDTLYAKFPDFRRAYDPNGMTVDEFDSFGPTVRTLRTFIASYHDLVAVVRDFMLPNPDVK